MAIGMLLVNMAIFVWIDGEVTFNLPTTYATIGGFFRLLIFRLLN